MTFSELDVGEPVRDWSLMVSTSFLLGPLFFCSPFNFSKLIETSFSLFFGLGPRFLPTLITVGTPSTISIVSSLGAVCLGGGFS